MPRNDQVKSIDDMVELDLPSANCGAFQISCNFTASAEAYTLATALTDDPADEASSDLADRPDVTRFAHYASEYKAGDSDIQVMGLLGRRTMATGGRAIVMYISYDDSEEYPFPAEDTKPISNLLEVFPSLTQGAPVEFDCFAMFNYEIGGRLQSRVSVPYPLLLAEPASSDSFTHVEAVILSRREGGEPTHTVMIESGNGGKSVAHHVSFKTDFDDGALTKSRISEIFEVARRLSLSLLDSPMEER